MLREYGEVVRHMRQYTESFRLVAIGGSAKKILRRHLQAQNNAEKRRLQLQPDTESRRSHAGFNHLSVGGRMSHYTGARTGEAFTGNTPTKNGVPEHLRHLTTARLGEQALDIEGRKIDPAYMLPLFVGKSDADEYNRIMTRRTFPQAFR